jgi:hypothetical protein
MAGHAEDYIRPPLVALEPPSRRAARWRFRAVMAVLVIILALVAVLVVRLLTGGGEGSPGLSNNQGAPATDRVTSPAG